VEHIQGILVWFSHQRKPLLLPGEDNRNAIFFLTLLNEFPLLIVAPLLMCTRSCLRLHFSSPTSVTNVTYIFLTHYFPSVTMGLSFPTSFTYLGHTHPLTKHSPTQGCLLLILRFRICPTLPTMIMYHYGARPVSVVKTPLFPNTLCLTHLIVPFYIVCSPSLSYNVTHTKCQPGLSFRCSWVNILGEGLTVMTCVSST